MFFFKKSKDQINNSTVILNTGKDMGRFTLDSSGDRLFTAGSGILPVGLKRNEYGAWRELWDAETINDWENACLEKGYIQSQEQLKDLRNVLEKGKIFLEINYDDLNNETLEEFTITNNGHFFGYSEESKKWIISGWIQAEKCFFMEDEEYHMWRSACGIKTIKNVIQNFNKLNKTTDKIGLKIFKKYVKMFVRAGLWNIEYCGKNSELYATKSRINKTSNQDWFDVKKINNESKLLAVGEDYGFFNYSKSGSTKRVIKLGKEEVTLEPYEYLLWASCKKGFVSSQELANRFNQDINQMNKYLSKMIQEKVLIIWPDEWNSSEQDILTLKATGIGLGSVDGKDNEIVDVPPPIGIVQTIPFPAYMIWAMSNSFMPISVLVDIFSKGFDVSIEESKKEIVLWIPYLLNRGLIHLQLVPFKSGI